MKGQIGVEHLVIVGLTIAVLVPGIYLFYQNTSENYSLVQQAEIDTAATNIITEVNKVNQLGIDSKQSVILNVPENFNNVSLYDNYTLVISYEGLSGTNEIAYPSRVKMIEPTYGVGLEAIRPGKVKLSFVNTGNGICLTTPEGSCDPSCGNGIVEPALGELCDTLDFGGLNCSDFSFEGGTLVCNSQCDGFITNFCGTCITLGKICLDDNAQMSGSDKFSSDYVETILGDSFGARAELYNIHHSGALDWLETPGSGLNDLLDTCGYPGEYVMKGTYNRNFDGGGGIKLRPDLVLSEGWYRLKTTLAWDDFVTYGDLGLQCNGQVFDVRRPPGVNILNVEFPPCLLKDTNNDIRFLGHGVDPIISLWTNPEVEWVRVETLEFEGLCRTSSTCSDSYVSDWECLSRGHTRVGNTVKSDFLIFEASNNLQGDVISSWDDLIDSDAYFHQDAGRVVDLYPFGLPSYERVCNEIYYGSPNDLASGGEGHVVYWNITGPGLDAMLDPVSPAGEYKLMINLLIGVESNPLDFSITCGDEPPVRIFDDNPNSHSEFVYMETYEFDCSFNGDEKDKIIIQNGGPSNTLLVERFRLLKRCN